MASSFFWKLVMVTLRLRSRNQSEAFFSSVEPAATQTEAPSRSLTAATLGVGRLADDEGLALVEVDALEVHAERVALREKVMVELRESRSTWPDCRIGQRCCTEVGVNLTFLASPSTAAASDLQ